MPKYSVMVTRRTINNERAYLLIEATSPDDAITWAENVVGEDGDDIKWEFIDSGEDAPEHDYDVRVYIDKHPKDA